MVSKDDRLFLSNWLRAPLHVGALLPSGSALAGAMAAEVDLGRAGAVVELGAGTGPVSRALLERGVAPENLVIIERDERFHALLTERFPRSQVIRGDATDLRKLLADAGIEQVSAVVSGLPLLSIPFHKQQAILRQCFSVMGAAGVLVQFTYGLRSPVPLRRLPELEVTGRPVRRVWLNLPPATVWRYTPATAPAANWTELASV
jgi:phosphatidylethanolamine/phosphatidyl-N-methylethanolamine N-methyltransferase